MVIPYAQSRNWDGSYTVTVAAVPFIRQEITPQMNDKQSRNEKKLLYLQ